MIRRVALIGVLAAVLGISGFLIIKARQNNAHTSAHGTLQQALGALPERAGDHPPMKLKSGLMPPTNKWFSGAVFGDKTQPIFAYPLSYVLSGDTVEIGYPQVKGTSDAVFAPHVKAASIQLNGATRYEISHYDDLLVTATYYDANNKAVADVTIARGSPYTYVVAQKSVDIRINASALRTENGVLTAPGPGGSLFGVYSESSMLAQNGEARLTLGKGKLLSSFIAPKAEQKNTFLAAAPNVLQKSTTTYAATESSVTTTFALQTRNNKETLYAFQAYDAPKGKEVVATYQSLQGPLPVIKGTSFTFESPRVTVGELKLNMLSVSERDDVKAKVAADVKALDIAKTDTYFGGKELYRAANLLQLANELGMDQEKQTVQTQLAEALHGWFASSKDSPRAKKYFYYDTTIKSVIGAEPSFGSQELNDHHFHYGYFIYAASILARYDQNFEKQDGSMVNLLIEDIASEANGPQLPRLRNFDPWSGHSYASGYSPFADGNNQESSSEALHAWGGMLQWASVTSNNTLRDRAAWLYARESQSALRYWFTAQDSQLQYGEYAHKLVSLVWDGKRDYATFFSPRPQAKLGIQLIPMSSAQSYLKTMSKSDIEMYIREAAPTDAELNGQFGDYIVMFLAQVDKDRAKALLPTMISANAIDDGNSLSYLTAWVYAGGLQ